MIKHLQNLAIEHETYNIKAAFSTDIDRGSKFSMSAAELCLDYSFQKINTQVINALCSWGQGVELTSKIKAMRRGDKINHTEGRAVLHSILRSSPAKQEAVLGLALAQEVKDTDKRMAMFVNQLHGGELLGFSDQAFTDVIAVGIGGSYYGPKVCAQALKPYTHDKINVHYLANIDGEGIDEKLSTLNPETTLMVIISKTFVTQETLLNANAVKAWLLDNGCDEDNLTKHLIAVSSHVENAVNFGVDKSRVLPMWDWVGGRFSLWSAVGFPLACAIGIDNYNAVKAGANEMDEHFETAPLMQNMPVMLGLLGIWNRSFLKYPSLAVLPYSHALSGFPGYLQQVDMESNGKRVDHNGELVELLTAPVVFGQEGTNSQHAFMQMMHQGQDKIPCEFILPLSSHSKYDEHHKIMVANCLAQSEALMNGKSLEQVKIELTAKGLSVDAVEKLAPHKVMPGNSPSLTITMDKLTPKALGSLLALYEHKIFVQGVMWQVNSFDQWGVELGKELSASILNAIDNNQPGSLSPATNSLIERYKKVNAS